MILPIIKHPNPDILQIPCTDISKERLASKEIQDLIPNMKETMHNAKGVGLAAPQIGQTIRITVVSNEALPASINLHEGSINTTKDLVLINPTWDRTNRKTEWDTEGCLSIPKVFGQVKRFKHIQVTALDTAGNELRFDASNFFARVIQHEIDHLDGVLFIEKGKKIYEVE